MKRFAQFMALATSLFVLSACNAQTSELDPTTYKPVRSEFPVSTGEKIEVIELFWFKCGACYALEPSLKKWVADLGDNVEFVKVPARFSQRWDFDAQAYYTMETLGVESAVYDAFFEQIHVKRRPIASADELGAWLGQYGFEAKDVVSTFNSFAVDTKMRNAKRIAIASGASAVPTMIIDGKYTTSASEAGSAANMFRVVDQLIEKAAAER